MYPEGPRIRDRLSHGESSLCDVDRELADSVLCVCVQLAVKFLPADSVLKQVGDRERGGVRGVSCYRDAVSL